MSTIEQAVWFWLESTARVARKAGAVLPFPYGFLTPEDGVPPSFYASPLGAQLVKFLDEQIMRANPRYPVIRADEWTFESHTQSRWEKDDRDTPYIADDPPYVLPGWYASYVVPSIYDRVILMGCGVDSTLAVYYAKYALKLDMSRTMLVHVNYQGPYSDKESSIARALLPHISLSTGADVRYVNVWRTEFTQDQLVKGYILPLRNMMLAAIGASQIDAGEVWLGANYRKVDDDVGAAVDKSRKFFGAASELLSAQFGVSKRVMSPFLHLSKADTVRWAIDTLGRDYTQRLLSKTTTCYHPTEHRCGACYACFKLAMMVKSTGIELDGLDMTKVESHPDFRTYLTREWKKGRILPLEWADLAIPDPPP